MSAITFVRDERYTQREIVVVHDAPDREPHSCPVSVRVGREQQGGSHAEVPPFFVLGPTLHLDGGSQGITREEWEELKRRGDQAWAEWEKRFGGGDKG